MLPMPLTPGGPPILVGGNTDRRTAPRRPLLATAGTPGTSRPPSSTTGSERLAVASRALDDLELQVGVRFGGPLDELAMLVDAYTALGATRVTVTAVLPPSQLDARLTRLAEALDVHPPVA